ncbi:MAG: SGNH/GDSL hydrolase family protein [Ruminococcaceae bacterium]|nr:SGNH/GDSL hydrolase family protein [Oscillospiraceae bacterium]
MKRTYSVLFIGNSYTYYNDMPTEIFKRIAESGRVTVDVTAITKGSHTLSRFADPYDSYGASVERELTGDKKYDYVILQEQSCRPITENAGDFYSAVRNLAERIRYTGAEPILYATWGREKDSPTLEQYGWTNESMTWKLAAAYRAIGGELDIPVAYVGLAFYDVYSNRNDIELYAADRTHPSYSGSYLAAVSLFSKIFGVDPTDIKFTGGLSAEDSEVLCRAAKNAICSDPAIPKEYITSSIGIK